MKVWDRAGIELAFLVDGFIVLKILSGLLNPNFRDVRYTLSSSEYNMLKVSICDHWLSEV